MNVTVLCSDPAHPVNLYLNAWVDQVSDTHNVNIVHTTAELTSGDFLFLISCSEHIKQENRVHYTHTLVLHASDLPKGRGWSPHIWEIIQGQEVITLSLLEAEDVVDSGRIWLKYKISVKKTAVWSEVNHLLFEAEILLMNQALLNQHEIKPYHQNNDLKPTYYRKRTAEDSKVDPSSSISSNFDLIRMCDPERHPAWFEIHGQKYKLFLEKIDNE